jgi:ComF family protein
MLDLDRFVGMLAPHQCLACGVEGSLLCSLCMEAAGDPLPPRCVGCHKLSEHSRTCKSCKNWLVVDSVVVATAYEGLYEELLFALKFDCKRQSADPIAEIMSKSGIDVNQETVLCPVPTAPSRIRQRGFDHTKLITKKISKNLSLESSSILRRNTNTRQFGASRANRLKQMENEFYIAKDSEIKNKDIVLVDDVVTTGATLSGCAKVLKKAGAKSVRALVFAQKI